VNRAFDVAKGSHGMRAVPQSVVWRTFLRGLAIELDAQAGSDVSIAILRGVGRQMASLLPLVSVASLEALELEMNMVLAEIGWGRVQVELHEAERCVRMTHTGLPHVGSAGQPAGTWLAPVLEGLYQAWMGQQPGADGSLRAEIGQYEGDSVVIRYRR
jgi:Cellulose synthase subunit D